MSDRRTRSWFVPGLMLLVTIIVASTAIRIESYNQAVGGFLPRPQPPSIEGNDIKWRVADPFMAERSYRLRIAWDQGIALSDDFESETKELNQIVLTPEQELELAEIKKHAKLKAEFRHLVETMGLLQYPLVVIGLYLSWHTVRHQYKFIKTAGGLCLVINAGACGLMFYREYFPSLGW